MIRHEAIEKRRFDPRQSKARIGIWGGPIEHRHPEHAPAQNAKHGDQLDQAFRGSEPRFLSSATGFQHLVERLNLPPQGIPAKLSRGDRQIGDQLPVDLRPIGWLIALLNIEYRQGQRRISLLFSNRRQDPDAAVPQFDNNGLEPAFATGAGFPASECSLVLDGGDRRRRTAISGIERATTALFGDPARCIRWARTFWSGLASTGWPETAAIRSPKHPVEV